MAGKTGMDPLYDSANGGRSGAIALLVDRTEVLEATVLQLRKDLGLSIGGLPVPPLGEKTFEILQNAVLDQVIGRSDRSLQQILYRVDLPEAYVKRTVEAGGLHS